MRLLPVLFFEANPFQIFASLGDVDVAYTRYPLLHSNLGNKIVSVKIVIQGSNLS